MTYVIIVVLEKSHPDQYRRKTINMFDLSNYSSTLSDNFKVHMMTDTGEKTYKCDLCDYSSTQPCNLKVHMMNHTREKPYKCDLCDYRSTRSGDLIKHMITHTGKNHTNVTYVVVVVLK